jgi:hypothetical protein
LSLETPLSTAAPTTTSPRLHAPTALLTAETSTPNSRLDGSVMEESRLIISVNIVFFFFLLFFWIPFCLFSEIVEKKKIKERMFESC